MWTLTLLGMVAAAGSAAATPVRTPTETKIQGFVSEQHCWDASKLLGPNIGKELASPGRAFPAGPPRRPRHGNAASSVATAKPPAPYSVRVVATCEQDSALLPTASLRSAQRT